MMESLKMPVMFFGHGSPMNVIEHNAFTDFLSHVAELIPTPKVILSISAHWETNGTKVLKSEHPKTIHDFAGFPEALYQIQYPAKGAPYEADRIIKILENHHVHADSSWGLDHGTWSILKHIYPHANIPVMQLSLNTNLSFEQHLKLAHDLKPLREEGGLILGTGNITHNLRKVVWDEKAPPLAWAVEFDLMIKNALINRDENILLNKDPKYKDLWMIAHPTVEHYLPLLYIYGASYEKERLQFIYEGMQLGSLSMRSLMYHA